MSGSGKYLATLKWFFQSTAIVWKVVAIYFKIFFPEYYEKYQQAFEAGQWEQCDFGPFIGKAVIYKLDVFVHLDRRDAGPVVSFPSGIFEGGSMSLPQLRLKLQ